MNPPEMTIAYLTKDIITAQHQGDKCLISRISCILLDNPGRSGMIGQRTLKGLPRTMAKVALVNPQLASSGWTRGLRPRHMDDLLPRHSLTYLSASLKAAGHTVLLLDLRLLSSWDDYEAALERERPGFVCVTAHTSEMDYALECFARAKRMLPGCVTVGGGIHLTMDPEAGLACGALDFVLRGEGEVSLPELVGAPGQFPPTFWGEPPDLDRIPFEDRELYPDYGERVKFPLWDLPTPIVDVLTKRGCPWKCRFCCGPGEQNLYTRPARYDPEVRIPTFRHRSVPHVIAELEQLHRKYAIRGVIFHDDQFLIRKNWVIEFCQALRDAGFVERGIRWWAASRGDVICKFPDVIERMRDAGLQILSIGFESFSDRMLDWMKKQTSRDQNLRAAEICRTLGIDIFANVILGMPDSDGEWHLQDDLASLDAIREIRPRYFSPSFFSPIPGSWFHGWAKENDLILGAEPGVLGSRTPDEMRVRGVDYARLKRVLADFKKEMGYEAQPGPSLVFRLKRFWQKPFAEKLGTLKKKLSRAGSFRA